MLLWGKNSGEDDGHLGFQIRSAARLAFLIDIFRRQARGGKAGATFWPLTAPLPVGSFSGRDEFGC